MEETTLPNDKIQHLRATGILSESEIAAKSGDLIIAIDVVTHIRRVITVENLAEGSSVKRLLKG
jgi:hypothetical protein|tara:strand:+ start:194 stop:385 length:192 start_codon:yes stop_codon:yes gene_type:complete